MWALTKPSASFYPYVDTSISKIWWFFNNFFKNIIILKYCQISQMQLKWQEFFCIDLIFEGSNFSHTCGCHLEFEDFVDTIQISYFCLKMHQTWLFYYSNIDYVSRSRREYPHMNFFWEAIHTHNSN